MQIKTSDELSELGKAEIVDTCEDGVVRLWEVSEYGVITEYVELGDSTIITREEDNEEGPEFAFFPYN